MSALFKGKQGYVLVSDEPVFDAETHIAQREQTFAGSKSAIFSLANALAEDNVSYRVTNSGPVYTLTARLSSSDPTQEPLDRYEISTESTDKSIFEHPTVIAEAASYDALISDGQETFKGFAEDAADEKRTDTPTGTWTTQNQVIRHLKNGVTGFLIDFVVLRRFRQVDLNYAQAAGKFNLSAGNLIYTTAQLNLPAEVAFVVPDTPNDPSSDYSWGWKRRGQRVEIVGNYAEQTVELLFAPWSTLLYENAGGNLDW